VSKPFAGLPAFFAIALAAFGLDQAFKNWVVGHMGLYESIPLIPGLFALTYVRNIGAAFSAFSGQVTGLSLIAGVVAIAIVVYMIRLKGRTPLHAVSLGLLLGGTLGNFTDRIRLGYVVDMFDLQWNGQNIFPIFNIADIAIDVGVGLLLLLFFLESRREKRAAQQAPQDQSSQA
jgi:signal peptidase II